MPGSSAQWSCLVLAGRREPDRDVSGLERVMDGIDQVTLYRVKVNRPAQPRGEGSYDRLCVVAGAVEPAVHRALDPLAQRIEQRQSTNTIAPL